LNKRLRRDELRELVLDAGVAVLARDGVSCGLSDVTFGAAFEVVYERTGRRLTNASVYERVWADQDDFRWSVLERLVTSTRSVDDETAERVEQVLDHADVSSEPARLATLGELCRVVVQRHIEDAAARARTRIIAASMGALASRPPGNQDAGALVVRRALQDYVEREVDQLLALYRTIGSRLGLRMRDPLELRHLVLAVAALGDGIAARIPSVPEYGLPIPLPVGRSDRPDVIWSVGGLAVEGIALRMLELDPDWTPPDPG
jgi:hypothetical protein